MDRQAAVLHLIQESRRETGTRARMLRTEKALKALGLDSNEVASVMNYLDYWNSDTGLPYPKYVKVTS